MSTEQSASQKGNNEQEGQQNHHGQPAHEIPQSTETHQSQRGTMRRGPPPRRGARRGDRRGYPPKKIYSPKKRRLNLKRLTEFKWELNQLMQSLPENQRGTVKGSIIAKADKMDLKEAIDFVEAKEKEGILSKELTDRICELLHRYSTYR